MTLRDMAMPPNKNLTQAEIAAHIESGLGADIDYPMVERTGFGLCFSGADSNGDSGGSGRHFFGKSAKRPIIMPVSDQRS